MPEVCEILGGVGAEAVDNGDEPCGQELNASVPAERVVGQGAEGDGVAEILGWCDDGAPDENGGEDDEDVLEDTSEGEDKR